MITGALLLNPAKKITWNKAFDYAKRMALVLATIGLFYCLMESYVDMRQISFNLVGSAVINLLSGKCWAHMWYLYALLGIYLLLPIFKSYASTATKKEYEVLLGVLFFFTCVVPTINNAFGTDFETLLWLTSSVFYLFLGYYLHNFVSISKSFVAVTVVIVIFGVGIQAWAVVGLHEWWNWIHNPSSIFIVVWSIFIFLLMKHCLNRPFKDGGIIEIVAACSFGIYIFHELFLNVLYKMINWGFWVLPPVVFELTTWGIAFFGAFAVTLVLKKLPFFKTIL